MPQKILTRVKSAITGEEYFIGTTGSVEKVSVALSLPQGAEAVDWTDYHVEVEIPALEDEQVYPLDENGECSFEVPMGQHYIVVLPTLAGYAEVQDIPLTATLESRPITHQYSTATRYENVIVQARALTEGGGYNHQCTDMAGLTCTLTLSNGDTLTANFDNTLKAMFYVPFGSVYTVSFPYCQGYRLLRSRSTEHTAGSLTRLVIASYIAEEFAIYAQDDDGNKYYTPEEIEALSDPSKVKYLFVNTSALQASDRNDGSQGNGLLIDISAATFSAQWATNNTEFDTSVLPYLTAASQTSNRTYYSGAYNTEAIRDVGDSLQVGTPAADQCAAKTITINGVTHHGFLPAYGQMAQLVANIAMLRELTSATGRTFPNIASGSWWTSCLYSATYAVLLYYGGFGSNNKYNSLGVLCCFDLYN